MIQLAFRTEASNVMEDFPKVLLPPFVRLGSVFQIGVLPIACVFLIVVKNGMVRVAQ